MKQNEYMAMKLKEARKNAKVSAVKAGNAVGRSDKTIYAWENAASEPSGEQLLVLCKLYNVDISFFYSDTVKASEPLTKAELRLVQLYRESSEFGKKRIVDIAEAICLAFHEDSGK